MPPESYELYRPENSDLLSRMRETPSQLPNLSIYQAWQQDPRHFSENLSVYARQLGVGAIKLLLTTYDFGPLERAIQKCTPLPKTSEIFRRELPRLLETHEKLFPPQR